MLHNYTRVHSAVLAGASGVHVMTKLVNISCLCFLPLCVKLSDNIKVWGHVWNGIFCTDGCRGLIAGRSAGIFGLKVID